MFAGTTHNVFSRCFCHTHMWFVSLDCRLDKRYQVSDSSTQLFFFKESHFLDFDVCFQKNVALRLCVCRNVQV